MMGAYSRDESIFAFDIKRKHNELRMCSLNHKDCRNFRVLDYGMPKSVTYMQKSKCDFVKNVHIDKAAEISKNKCPVENCELDHNAISFLLNPDEASGSESFRDNVEKFPFPLDEPEMGVFQEPTQDSRKFISEKMIKREVDGGAADECETTTYSTEQILPDTFHQVSHVSEQLLRLEDPHVF